MKNFHMNETPQQTALRKHREDYAKHRYARLAYQHEYYLKHKKIKRLRAMKPLRGYAVVNNRGKCIGSFYLLRREALAVAQIATTVCDSGGYRVARVVITEVSTSNGGTS